MDLTAVEKAKNYIENLKVALHNLENVNVDNVRCVIEEASRYLRDAEFYLERRDPVTSIACSSYAEGLLDALSILGFIKVQWPAHKPPRVLVGGTFEIVHPGHLYLLRKARELGTVVVIVARDSTIIRLKGRKPMIPEKQRLEVIRSIRYVDEAYLGSEPLDIEGTLQSLKPDIILLGPDQAVIEEMVKKSIENLRIPIKIVKIHERIQDGLTSSSNIVKLLLNNEPGL
ncbi:MAG: DUF357 domain-containing protein [Thermofilaceae archaeon]